MRAPLLRALGPLLPGLRLDAAAAAGGSALAVAGARGVKTTTGIVGLPVVEDARGELKAQLEAVLDAVAAIPESAEYRRSVEKTVRYKLAAVEGSAPDEELEELFSRQLEEEIKMCKEELALIPKMAGGCCTLAAGWAGLGGRAGGSGEKRTWTGTQQGVRVSCVMLLCGGEARQAGKMGGRQNGRQEEWEAGSGGGMC